MKLFSCGVYIVLPIRAFSPLKNLSIWGFDPRPAPKNNGLRPLGSQLLTLYPTD